MFNQFPYTNFHDLNVDWILKKLSQVPVTVNNTPPDENGNINLAGVSGVTSVNGIGADGAGNIDISTLFDFIDIRTAPGFDDSAWADNTTAINDFIEEGKRYFFPSGDYVASIIMPPKCQIFGNGPDTTIYPGPNGYVIKIDGTYCKISDLKIMDTAPYSNDGIYCNTDCSNLVMENVIIENCYNGIHVTGNMIWATFIHVKSWGNKNNGLRINPSDATKYHNLNNYISCSFNNNVNEGIWLDSGNDRGFSENFIGCNIELNCNATVAAAMGVPVTASAGVYSNTSFITFQNCYFEGNANLCMQILKNVIVAACTFIIENVIFDISDRSTIFGCKDYGTVSTILSPGTDPDDLSMIGNIWSGVLQ